GRVVTRSSQALALALGPDGHGVAVGERGRIVDLDPHGAVLDAAAGVVCSQTVPIDAPPCGTSRDLHSVAVPPDGSAAGGGAFRAVTKPDTAQGATIVSISMPSPDQAWLLTDTREIYAGTLSGSDWSWSLESLDASGHQVTKNQLHALYVDASGHGWAV